MENLEHLMLAAGVKASVVAATVTTMRGLERDGVRWDDVKGSDLLQRCHKHPQRLHRLRRGLVHMYGAEVAKKQWAEVFLRTNGRVAPPIDNPKKPTLESVLPFRLRRVSAEDPVRKLFALLFRRWLRKGGPASVSTFRVYFAFLYTFLVSTPSSVIPDAHQLTLEELEGRLRALTHPDLVRAYDRFRQEATKTKQHLTLGALSMQLNVVTVVFRDLLHTMKRAVACDDFGIVSIGKRKRTTATSSVGNSTVTTELSIFGEEQALVDRSHDWVHDPKANKTGTAHCFNAQETRALYLSCETLIEKLLMTSLFTTGMRIGGFCNCERRGAVTDDWSGQCLFTNEKGNRTRQYPISPGMAVLLTQWFSTCGPGTRYLFPDRAGGSLPMCTRKARSIFMLVAGRAGVQGAHVKPHTTRHTVCWTLSALGNKLEEVADFAGHRSTSVTKHVYIAMEEAQKRSRMDIPWLGTDQVSGADRLQLIALELAGAIAGPFASPDGRSFPCYSKRLQAQRPRVHFMPPEPVDELQHVAVSSASNERAERKAAKKAEKKARHEALVEQILETSRAIQTMLH